MPRSPFYRPAVIPTRRGNPLGSPFNPPKRSTEPAPTTPPRRKRTPTTKTILLSSAKWSGSADDRRESREAQPAIERAKTRKPRNPQEVK